MSEAMADINTQGEQQVHLREIPVLLDRIVDALDGLETAVNRHSDRLIPVLRPADVEPAGQEAPEASSETEIGETLRGINLRIAITVRHLEELTGRCQL